VRSTDEQSDLIAMLRALQHQLANAVSAVCSHTAIIERQALSGRFEPRATASLSRACDQAMRVTDCIRHLLAVYDRPDSNADGHAVLDQTVDLLHALASRPVRIKRSEDADADWRCARGDAFVLIGLVLFEHRESIRRADRIIVSADRLAPHEIAVQLHLNEFADRPASSPAEPTAWLAARLVHAGVRVEHPRLESTDADTLRIILPLRD
jgi:hypothetical protein